MAEIINFPGSKHSKLSPELQKLIKIITSRVNEELDNPSLNIQGSLDDPDFADSLEEKLIKYKDDWQELLMRSLLIAVEETTHSELSDFK